MSAWWGQFESIYVLLGLLAAILVLADHPIVAAAALGLALMTKPQALPFLVPFAAYALGRYGWRRAAVFGIVTGAVAAATWLPFLADGGPSRYLGNLGHYQDGVFARPVASRLERLVAGPGPGDRRCLPRRQRPARWAR